jgi:hypothetical protein
MPVENGLGQGTTKVEEATPFQLDGRTVHLLDTPGFDDTEWSDVRIFRTIAEFLANQ